MFSRFMKSGSEGVPKTGQPLELVKYDTQSKKFEVGAEALEVLKAVKAPLGVVSVCGRARQGKSFILNQLLGQSSGFVVAPTHRPCTKGLWMWSAPVARTSADGSKHYLVMLDTEGIDAWDQTGQYSVQIFSLAVLLSSLFVYNQMGGIDEAALDRLSLVTEMTKHIRVRASNGKDNRNELSEFTPSFLWLLRDFYLQLEENGRQVSPREYLETALSNVPATSAGAKAKNDIRTSIKSLFPDRDCFALVRPMSDEAKLAHLETVPPAQLRPEFREGLARLVDICFARAQPKRIGSIVLTGPMLAGLVTAYVDAINKGAVPTIATAWQGVAESECRRAADAAERRYREEFDSEVTAEPAALQAEHQRALRVARELYDQEAVGDEAVKAAHLQKWTEGAERTFAQLRDRRLAEASQQVEALLNKANAHFNTLTADSRAPPSEITAAVSAFLSDYASNAAGPSKWPRLVEFLQSILGVMVKRMESAAVAKQAKLQQALERAEAAHAATRSELARLQAVAGSEENKARALAQQLDAAHRRAQNELQAERQRLQDQKSQAEKSLQAEVLRLRTQLASVEASASESNSAASKEKAEAQSLRRQLEDVSHQLRIESSAKLNLQNELQRTQTHYEEQLQAKQTELDADKQQIRDLLAERAANLEAVRQLQQETDRDVDMLCGVPADSPGEEAGPLHAIGGRRNGNDAVTPETMTIQEIKEWLTEHGYEDDVWTLANRKTPRVKKADWVALVKSK